MLAPIMLWRVLANLTKVDASAILAYLRSFHAVKNQGAKSLRPERETDLIRHEDCAARRQVIHASANKIEVKAQLAPICRGAHGRSGFAHCNLGESPAAAIGLTDLVGHRCCGGQVRGNGSAGRALRMRTTRRSDGLCCDASGRNARVIVQTKQRLANDLERAIVWLFACSMSASVHGTEGRSGRVIRSASRRPTHVRHNRHAKLGLPAPAPSNPGGGRLTLTVERHFHRYLRANHCPRHESSGSLTRLRVQEGNARP